MGNIKIDKEVFFFFGGGGGTMIFKLIKKIYSFAKPKTYEI